MPKSYKGSPSMADYGDGGSSPQSGKPRAHRGGPTLKARVPTPSGPGGSTHPAPFRGGPSVVARPTPKSPSGGGANTGAGATSQVSRGSDDEAM